MSKLSHILTLAAVAALALPACNSDYEPDVDTSKDVQVTAFSLNNDSKVAEHLDSVYFSIDLVNARIFNADSLPYGTNVSRLIPNITFGSVSGAELIVTRPGKADTVYNYLANPSDSIDFSNGPVSLRLTSSSGTNSRTYTINVNVHQVKADSLQWTRLGDRPANRGAKQARTVECNGEFYSLTLDGTNLYLICQELPGSAYTDRMPVTLSGTGTPQLSSFTATNDALFVLDTDGNLITSAPDDNHWVLTGQKWYSIIGNYGNEVIGTSRDAQGHWMLNYFPSGRTEALPQGFPVSGVSQSVPYTFEMSTSPMMMILGGRDADGNLLRGCWSYDGSQWLYLTQQQLPVGLESALLLPYYSPRTSLGWKVSTRSALVVMGGRLRDGSVNPTVYISNDFGMHWTEAPSLMQLPKDVTPGYGAQGFVHDAVIHTGPAARIVRPITQWDCPYIYLYGGYDAAGNLYDSVWRGVINNLSFKPIE